MHTPAPAREIHLFTRVIAASQIVGSVFCAFVVGSLLITAPFNILFVLIALVMFVFFSYVLMSGVWLWSGSKRGYRSASIVQALQIPVIYSVPLTYKFIFGVGVLLTFQSAKLGVDASLGGESYLVFLTPGTPFGVGVNLWAMIALSFILKQKPNDEEQL